LLRPGGGLLYNGAPANLPDHVYHTLEMSGMGFPHPRVWLWLRRLTSLVVSLGALVGLIAWMSGAFHPKVSPGEVPFERRTVGDRQVVAVRAMRTRETVDAVGTVQPRHKIDVASQILAVIRDVKARAGDRVEMGQTLVVFDDREVRTQLNEAEAAFTGYCAEYALREREYQRYNQMLKDGSVTREEFDRVEGAFEVARARRRRSDEMVSRAQVQLSYTVLKATTAGIVADRYADPGDLAVPGKPLLTLHDPAERELQASVPESLSAAVRLNQELTVQIDALGLRVGGVVREIVPQAQTTSRSVLVKVSLPPSELSGVYNGMFGRLIIPTGEVERLAIPAAAVQQVGQLDLVDVAAPDGTLERRFVRLGRRWDGSVEVLSGLDAGERLALPSSSRGR
jgi:RND family efflux transporter MFP subunit